jgi:high-affinity Fe2+/Pb2+ permease
LFEPTIVSDVVIATAFGFAVAFVMYWWFSKSRGALRFIDLISFAIGSAWASLLSIATGAKARKTIIV